MSMGGPAQVNTHQDTYRRKLSSRARIASRIRSGWSCCSDIASSVPYGLYWDLAERVRRGQIEDLRVYTIMDMSPLPFYQEDMGAQLKGFSWFSGAGARGAVNAGFGEYLPCYYRDVPALLTQYTRVDAFFAVVSPMDEQGYFSFGPVGSCTESLLKKSDRVFLQVNHNVPRALRGPLVHISQVDGLWEEAAPLPTLPPVSHNALSATIGGLVAEEFPNGATIQLGVGAIPEAITEVLRSKHDLGLHTELLTDGMVDLIRCGAVTNEKKPLHTGLTVATFGLGQKVYSYIHENPAVELLPVSYVNDPAIIARHPDFVSVNAALEVDFWGQVCAESMGPAHVSGTGGQSDFVRGAISSKGGKSFIVFPSTARNGTVSRIVSQLSPGAVVSTSKNDVDYIATEYGIAKLRGQSLSQRTRALIGIAHPNFRDQLTFEAKKRNILV